MQRRREIKFCSSRDGTRLAWSAPGHGRPFVIVLPHNADRLDAPTFLTAQWDSALFPELQQIRYDGRGCGLSERRVDRLTFEAFVEDLAAVVDAVGPGPVALGGFSHGSPIAIQYAATNPQRVTHLVMYGGYARGRMKRRPDAEQEKEAKAILDAVEIAFGDHSYSVGFRRTFVAQYFPRATPEQLDIFENDARGRMSGAVAVAYTSASFQADVSAEGQCLTCPTIVFHARGDRVVPFDEAKRLAALIPGAEFVSLDSDQHLPLESDPEWPVVVEECRRFLSVGQAGDAASPAERAAPRGERPSLTRRQVEVLQLVSHGQTDKEIARLLSLSPRTVEMHVAAAMKALGGRTRAEAVHLATMQGWLAH
jgi:pimeloyl-ACP methyl ester carboxylesterase/DNA-binding CsgD family transcriptional regulator